VLGADGALLAPVAQRIEQQPSNLSVVGSIPTGGAKPGSDWVLYFRDTLGKRVAPHIAPHMWRTPPSREEPCIGRIRGRLVDRAVQEQCRAMGCRA
jgi:hypothetical protein